MPIKKSKFIDPRDNHVYKTVIIGKQEWFAENLFFATLDGFYSYDQADPDVRDDLDDLEVDGGYGYLYTIEAANMAAPEGWRLPSESDFIQLARAVGVPKMQTIRFLSKFLKNSLFNCDKRWDDGAVCECIQSLSWNDACKDPFGFSAIYSGYGYLIESESDGYREQFLEFKGRGGYEEEDPCVEARLWMSSECDGKPAYFFIEKDRVGFSNKLDRTNIDTFVNPVQCLCSVRLVRDVT